MKYAICSKVGVKATSVLSAVNAASIEAFPFIPRVAFAELTDAQVESLRANPAIEDVHEEVVGPKALGRNVDLQSYVETWGIQRIKADVVHQTGNTGQRVRVCIVDTGGPVNLGDHEDLISAGGFNFLNNTPNFADDNQHGTHVHGILAAKLNGLGVAGASPDTEVYHAKVLSSTGGGAWSTIVAGVNYCIQLTENGTIPVVSNHSYGGSTFPGAAVRVAYETAASMSVHLLAAAGNNGPGNGNTVGYPALFDACIAVSSIDIGGNISGFSSIGPKVEVAAPGGAIYSTLPGNGYGNLSGTSMACPHVAGAFALAIAAGVSDPRAAIPGSTDRTGRTPDYGYGVIDCVKLVQGGTPPTPEPPPSPPDEPPTTTPEPILWVGGTVQCDATPSSDPDGTIVSYDWWITDYDTWIGPRISPKIGIGFGNPGQARNVWIGLRVIDDQGAKDVEWKYLRVYSEADNPTPPPPPPSEPENQSPIAAFTIT